MFWSSHVACASMAFALAACQFDPSIVPIAPVRRSCEVELQSAHFEPLLPGTKLAQVHVARSYDDRIYASYFDEEADERLLWFVTDNFAAPCENEQLLGNGTLRACRTPHVSAAHAVVPDPVGVQALLGPMGAIDLLPLLVPDGGGGIIDPFSRPEASSFLVAADGESHYAVSSSTGLPSSQGTVYVRHRGMGSDKYDRAYMAVLSDRAPMLALLPQQLPWLFLHDARDPTVPRTVATPRLNLVCRPDAIARDDVVPWPEECRSLPFAVEAVAAGEDVMHVAGTADLRGDQMAVVYTALSDQMTRQTADPAWLDQRVEQVYRSDLSNHAFLPSLAVGPEGPAIAYRIDGAVALSRRVNDEWKPAHPVPIAGAGAPKIVRDRWGSLHVFLIADRDGDGKSESLQHLTVPPCVD